MKKRILMFLMCCSLVTGLVACSNNSKPSDNESSSSELSVSVSEDGEDTEKVEDAERTLEGEKSVDADELQEKEEISADEITKTESKPEIIGDDASKQSVVKTSVKASNKVKKAVKKAKKAYNDAQSKAKKVATSSDSYEVYVDSNNCIREMIAYPKLYGDISNATVKKAKAYYYYSVKDGFSTLRFVYIKKADGGEVRFYLAKSKKCPYTCYRYVENGKTKDYPKGVNPEKVSPYGVFCSKAYMEPHWFGQQ